MPPIDADYSFRNVRETFNALLAELERLWPSLDDPSRAPLSAALTTLQAQLDDAEGDIARGTALSDFLYTLDKVSPLPTSVQAILDRARGPRSRGGVLFVSSADARDLAKRAALLTVEPSAPATPPISVASTSADTSVAAPKESDIASQALGLLEAINQNWDKLSTRQQDIASEIVYSFVADMEQSATDEQRTQAGERLLDAIASNPALAAKLPAVVRRGEGSSPWDRVLSTANNSPGLATLGRAVESAPPDFAFDIGGIVAANGGATPPLAMADDGATTDTMAYFTDLRFPGQVSTFQSEVPLIVRLTIDIPKESRAVEQLDVRFESPDEPELIEVVCQAEDFDEATGDATRTLIVYKGKDTQPAVFLLTPREGVLAGQKRVVLDFVHRGRILGHASFFTELIDRPSQQPKEIVSETTLNISELRTYEAEPVDLELRVTLGANKTQLMYMLHSPKGSVGYHWQNVGSVQLDEEPRLFLQTTINRLNKLARKGVSNRTDEQTADFKAALERIGQDLYDQIFSDELKREYAGRISKLHKDGVINNLLITSDEPWIPWEILKPYQADLATGDVLVNDDFLCAEFKLSRWLAGRGIPDFVEINDARIVAPPSNLAAVKREIDYFETTVPDRLHRPSQLPLESVAEVLDALGAKAGNLYHFSCHGNFDADNADESPLQLKDGEIFAPNDITGPYERGVIQSKPLVFLNACYAGQIGRNIRGLGGWAQRFVSKGASAFVGGMWEVNDNLAAEFAITFYDKLWSGATIGEAFHGARAHLRAMDPANPTWLAYTLYADPNGFAKTPE
ncbi:MAG: CHAT domain-containing protein [Anaerolineae bacterium]|nr:CHAT domain-containing protein [Anaerolineae bacterium]